VEKLSFRFGKINWSAFPAQPGGPGAEIKHGWDIRTNQKN
jgi:hypothetical protein